MKLRFDKINWTNLLLIVVLTLLLVYIAIRAFYISFTHDEGLSFQIILGDEILEKTANNHFLNTFLMNICYTFFGKNEFSLRIPNSIAFVVYAIACYKFLKNKNITIVIVGVSLLLLNPYLLDFFSIARGYGLALGFCMLSLYYFIQAYNIVSKEKFVKNALISLCFSLLAASANLIYINFYFASLFILLIEFIILVRAGEIKNRFNHNLFAIIVIVINMICLGVLLSKLIGLKNTNELYFGGNNFINSTLMSLVTSSAHHHNYNKTILILIQQAAIGVFIVSLFFQHIKKYDSLFRITILILILITMSSMEYAFWGVLYPKQRTGLIFIILFGVFILQLFERIQLKVKSRKKYVIISLVSSILIGIPSAYNFIVNMNTSYVLESYMDSHTKNVVEKIKGMYEKNPTNLRRLTISNTWLFEPSINYYKDIYSMDYMEKANRESINKNADFIYLLEEELDDEIKHLYTNVYYYSNTRSILMKRKNANFEKKEIGRSLVQLKSEKNKCVFTNDFKIYLDTIGKNIPDLQKTFVMIQYEDSTYVFRTHDNYFLTSELDIYNRISASRTKVVDAWELFKLIKVDDKYFALKACNDKYLSLDKKSAQLYARISMLAYAEKFELINK